MARLGLSNADHGEGKAWTAIAIGLFVAFGGVLFGYVLRSTGKCCVPVTHQILDSELNLFLSIAMTRVQLAASLPCLIGRSFSALDT